MGVLSPYPAERVQPILVEELLAEGLRRHQRDPSSWHGADGLPYGYDVQPPDVETDPEELRLVERAAGRPMRCEVLLHIFVSDLAGRPTLARIAQRVAERSAGWVFVEFSGPPAVDLLDVLGDAGRCVRAGDAVYLDAVAMAAWIAHPDFHVVK